MFFNKGEIQCFCPALVFGLIDRFLEAQPPYTHMCLSACMSLCWIGVLGVSGGGTLWNVIGIVDCLAFEMHKTRRNLWASFHKVKGSTVSLWLELQFFSPDLLFIT